MSARDFFLLAITGGVFIVPFAGYNPRRSTSTSSAAISKKAPFDQFLARIQQLLKA